MNAIDKLLTSHRSTIVRQNLTAEVMQRDERPETWAIEAIDEKGDGEVYVTLFTGPFAKERALDYAAVAYQRVRLR